MLNGFSHPIVAPAGELFRFLFGAWKVPSPELDLPLSGNSHNRTCLQIVPVDRKLMPAPLWNVEVGWDGAGVGHFGCGSGDNGERIHAFSSPSTAF